MKFILADGKIKFITHKVEWQEKRKQYNTETKKMEEVLGETRTQEFWSVQGKDNFVTRLEERDIEVTVTELEQPSAEIIELVEGKTFSSYNDAIEYISNPNKSKIAELKEQIQATDYKIIKCSEYQLKGLELPYDINALHNERQALRDEINTLEQGV